MNCNLNHKLAVLFVLIFLLSPVYSIVVVNSFDGRDLISATYYGLNAGEKVIFVPLDGKVNLIINKIPINEKVFIIKGKTEVYPALKVLLQNKGVSEIETFESLEPYNTNLELAKKANPRGYVIIDPNIGYNAVPPLAFAKQEKLYLLFGEANKTEQIKQTVNGKYVLFYGYVDQQLKKEIMPVARTYEEINNGDKYEDCLKLLDKYLKSYPARKQVILTDGNFYEETIMAAEDPVMLISSVIPSSVKNYATEKAKSGQIKVMLLIGTEYSNTAYNLKKTINNDLEMEAITVFVKVGEAVPKLNSQVFPSSVFPLYAPFTSINIAEITYNQADGNLNLVVKNTGIVPGYFTYSLYLLDEKNGILASLSNEEIAMLEPGKTMLFESPVSIPENYEGSLFANTTIIYGVSKNLLDNGYNQFFNVGKINFMDKSNISIESAIYDVEKDTVTVKLKNTAEVKAYYKITVSYYEDGLPVSIYKPVDVLEPNTATQVNFDNLRVSNPDSANLKAKVEFGQREYALNKIDEKNIEITRGNNLILILIIVLMAIIIYLYFKKETRQKQEPASFSRPKPSKRPKR